MATSAWFDYNGYMNNKLAQLQKDDSAAGWDMTKLVKAFADAGFEGATGAERHFEQYGQLENVAPNAFFNPTEYFRAKAAEFYGVDPKAVTDLQVADMQVAIQKAGMSAWSHYEMYGTTENVNPSNSFNTQAYMAAKLAVMQAGDATYTMAKLNEAFKAAGLSALEHFMIYAGEGAGEVTQGLTTDGKIPAEFAVPENQKVNSGGGGETFTLTVEMDNIVGTAGNDTINGGLTGGTDPTLQAFDTIDGGEGVDTLNITATAAADILGGAFVKNVENINVRVTTGTAATFDASGAIGLTNVNSNVSTGTLVVTNLAKDAAVTITGDGTVANGAVAIGYAAATDAVTLNFAGGTKMAATVTVDGTLSAAASGTATSATINSNGAANTVGTVDLANASLTSVTFNAATNLTGDFLSQNTDQVGANGVVTIKGAATAVTFTQALDDTITTIDASGLTAGGLKATLGTGIKTFMGGQGNDVITAAATTTTGAVIDAGAGTADKLILAATNDVSSAAKGAQYKNFEILNLADSQDVSLIAGITSIELNTIASGNISKLSAAQAAAITVKGNLTTAATLSLADATGTADVVSLALKSDTATANVGITALTMDGVETLNIAATTGAAGASSDLTFASVNHLTAINISGTANVGLVGTNIAKAVTVNSTTTGKATISGNFVNGSSITTGAGVDTITLGTGFAAYNSGAGNDIFNATAAQLNTGANYNVINGGEGIDTLNITGGTALTLVDNNLSKITGIEKIVVATTTSNAQSISTGGFFNEAFKAGGIDLTTTSTTGIITIDMNSFTGAATLTTTSTTGAQVITTGTAGGNDNVTAVAGTGDVTVATGAGDDVVTVTTVGTGNTEGGIVITTGAGNDTITIVSAAAGEDATITAGTGADEITLGLGGAKVVIGAGDSGITLETADMINGFKTTDDKIALGFTGGLTNASEAGTAVADFAAALASANTALAALKASNPISTELANFQWDATNGYLFNDTNGDGTADQVIVLVGIDNNGFAITDIVA